MKKVVGSKVRAVVLNIKEFCRKEKEADDPIIPFENVYSRVAAATGLGAHTLQTIFNEGKMTKSSSNKRFKPEPKKKMREYVDKNLTDVVLRVRDFFKKEKQNAAPIIPFERVYVRVSFLTGISLGTVFRIVNGAKATEPSPKNPDTREQQEKREQKKYKANNQRFLDILAKHNFFW